MANLVALFVPFPIMISPVEVIGDKALKAALAVVCPVPPLAIFSVPPTVIAPADAVEGVKPVDAKLIEDTPAGEAQVAVVPLEVKT